MSAAEKAAIGETESLPGYSAYVHSAQCSEEKHLSDDPALEAEASQNSCQRSYEESSGGRSSEDISSRLPNEHLNMDFEDIFHEHQSTYTHPKIHHALKYCFKYTKLFVYNGIVFLFAMKLVFIMAIIAALLNFLLVWVWNPLLKTLITVVRAGAPVFSVPFQAICNPVADCIGRVFRQIHIKGNVSEEEKYV